MKARELLNELEINDIGYYNPSDDDLTRADYSDTRKPKLTLRHLNRLKKIRATREVDLSKHQTLLGVMYAAAEEEGGGGGMI